MADRTSAAVFAELFEMLAGDAPIDRAALASKFWENSQGYDFDPCQMDCDDALVKLGLARKVVNPNDSEDWEWRYGPEAADG